VQTVKEKFPNENVEEKILWIKEERNKEEMVECAI